MSAALPSDSRYMAHERSLAIRLKVHGTEEHPDVAASLHNMGAVLQAQGRYAEAATHYERSLAIYIKVHGTEEHSDVARTRRNLQSLRRLAQWSRVFLCAALLLLLYLLSSRLKPHLMPFETRDEL